MNTNQVKLPNFSHIFSVGVVMMYALVMFGNICSAQTQGGTVVAWGDNGYGQTNVPSGLTNVVSVSGGQWFSLALNQDGTVVAWGDNSAGQTNIPDGTVNISAVSAGANFALALKQDGTVVAWGDNSYGQTNLPSGLTNVVAISAGYFHCLALKSDGTVTGWGDNSSGEVTVPTGLSNVVAIAAGQYSSLALLNDGTITGWGLNTYGQASTPNGASNFVAIASGTEFYDLALQTDGTVIAWGNGAQLQLNVPPGLSNIVAVATGYNFGLALGANGIVSGWGYGDAGEITFPPGLTNVMAISAGGAHGLAIVNNGLPKILKNPSNVTLFSGQTPSFTVYAVGASSLAYQWQFNETNLDGATNATLTIGNVQPGSSGTYQVLVSNGFGTVLSSNCALDVIATPPIFTLQPSNQVVVRRGNVNFNAAVTGSIPVAYQWQFDSTNIVGATSSTLSLQNVQYADGGSYTLIASNSFGYVISSNAMLVVAPTQVIGWGFTNDDYGNYAGQIYPPLGLTNVIAIAAGGSHSLALNSDGTVAGWGDNNFGESVPPANLTNATAIAAGYNHSVIVKSDGSVLAWGDNSFGQTNVPVALTNAMTVSAGYNSCVALKNDRTVTTWGADITSPPPSATNDVLAVAEGWYHCLSLKSDGTVIAWGQNNVNQTNVPPNLSNVVAVAAGGEHSLALKLDGTVVAWGDNAYGQTNVPYGLSNVVAIAGGGFSSLALQNNGTVVAWGAGITAGSYPNYGQSIIPTGLSNVVAIAAGGRHCLALVNDGSPVIVNQPVDQTVYSGSTLFLSAGAVAPPPLSLQWQLNGTNLIGATNSYLLLTNVQPDVAGNYSLVAGNPNTGIAVSSNALLTVITSPPIILNQPTNFSAQLGAACTFGVSVTGSIPAWFQWQFNGTNITDATNSVLTLAPWSSEGNYSVIVSNAYGMVVSSNAALTTPRSLIVPWGQNVSGQTNIPASLGNVLAISAGGNNSMALKSDGTVAVWGDNSQGQKNIPSSVSNVVAIACGSLDDCLVLKNDATVIGWGLNGFGKATAPSGLSNVVAIAAGDNHTLALQSNGKVVAWGSNSSGQTNAPVSLTNAVAIAAGSSHSLALRGDGTVAAWGANNFGQTNVPVRLTNVVAIAACGNDCLALQSNGMVVAWGNNSSGQTNVPASLSNVVAIAAGTLHNLALRSDGMVVAWGSNSSGQTNAPSGLGKVVAIAAGQFHSLALLSDGPPLIATQPLNQTNYAGLTIAFTATALGLNPLSYQWFFNGTNIDGATNAGIYSFSVSNNFGTAVSSNATLTVIAIPPSLALQPTNQIAIAGSNVTFAVVAEPGPVPITYQWQLNETNIDWATNASLTLTNVQLANQGSYDAVLSNGFGSITSSNALLTVIVLDLATALDAPGFVWTNSGSAAWFAETNTSYDGFEAAQSGTVANGQQSILQTTVAGPGTLTFWWMFTPLTVPFANVLSFSTSQSNNAASVSSTIGWQQKTFYLGAGTQTLNWTYARYSIFSAPSTGWVDQVSFVSGGTAPFITNGPVTRFVRANANASFSVGAGGTPPLFYQWQFDTTNLVNQTNATLTVLNAQPVNSGVYSVVVTNSFGSLATNAALSVQLFAINTNPTNLLLTTNGFELQIDGVLTANPMVILGSTDLVNWLPLFTNPPTTGSIQFLDVGVTNLPARFYKAQE